MSMQRSTVCLLACCLFCGVAGTRVGAAQVNGQVSVTAVRRGAERSSRDETVVVWLTPSDSHAETRLTTNLPHITLLQKNKTFSPHVLAVQAGSEVDFPNRDPFFHNVFSLFNGKRFDLGLYEAGSTRSVHFDRPGICYIFCNIHPQMSAVIVVVDTPYFALADAQGKFLLPDVPPGQYQLHLWEEYCTPQTLQAASRQVTLAAGSASLAAIPLHESGEPITAHLNKYGKPYDPQVFSSPLYLNRE